MKSSVIRIVLSALVGLCLTGSLALATPMSTPAIMQIDARPTSARIMVMAGTSGAPAGFTVEWVRKSVYDANGGWPAAGDPSVQSGDFFGVPVWIVQGQAGNFTLPPIQWQAVAIGELFDESGVLATDTGELDSDTQYMVRVKAKAYGSYTESAPTAPQLASTSVKVQNCTYTQGYWKNHTNVWPAGSLTLGTVTYTAAQLQQILDTPAGGNGLLILAHQLIAAKLNILNGADATAVATTIAQADALIGNLVVPPVGGGSLAPSAVNALATTLDDYNNGVIGPGHCGVTPAQATTWGTVKSTYRR